MASAVQTVGEIVRSWRELRRFSQLELAVIYSQWRDQASVEAMQTNPDMVAYFPKVAALAAFDSLVGDVVYNHHA